MLLKTSSRKKLKGGYYVQHMAGMLVVGAIMYALMAGFGHYYIEGVGYATVQDILSGTESSRALLLLLLALKLAGDVAHARFGCVRRDFFASSVSGSHGRRGVRRFAAAAASRDGHQPARVCRSGNGGNGRRIDRRRDGGDRHDI